MSAYDPKRTLHITWQISNDTLFGLNVLPLCGGVANRVLAGLAQSGEVLFHAQKQATCAELETRTLVPDIRPASFARCGDLQEGDLAWFTKFFEMCLVAQRQRPRDRDCRIGASDC